MSKNNVMIIKKNGFSLIELMIVVAIIAVLATMALPRYSSYFTKARQAEVAMILASLHTAEQVHHAEHGSYSTVLWGKDGIGWMPQGYKGGGKQENFYYTYGFFFDGAREGTHFFTGKLEIPASNLSKTHAKDASFIVGAAGQGNGDSIDLWSMSESRQLIHESK